MRRCFSVGTAATAVLLGAFFVSNTAQAFAQSTDLEHGKIEIRGFGGGIKAGNLLVRQPAFSAGVEGAIGLNRIVAVTGDYAFDHLYSFDLFQSRVHEFMGGFRFSISNHSRITPYGAVSVGGVALVESSGFFGGPGSNFANSTETTHFAIAIGPGVNYRINSHTGIAVDVRGVAISFGLNSTPGWFVRTTGGIYFRF
jgi:hypothetical protein